MNLITFCEILIEETETWTGNFVKTANFITFSAPRDFHCGNCHENAVCEFDTNGNGFCTCNDGFTGNGFICEGICFYQSLLYLIWNW